jgi:hypothetical protein
MNKNEAQKINVRRNMMIKLMLKMKKMMVRYWRTGEENAERYGNND